MVVLQGNRLDAVVLQDRYIGGGDVEEEFVLLLAGRNVGGVRERTLKIDKRQIIVEQDIPHVFHDEIYIAAVFFQLFGKDVLFMIVVAADCKIAGAGDGHDNGAVIIIGQFFLFGFRNVFQQIPDVHLTVLLHRASGRKQNQQRQQTGKYFSEHAGFLHSK